MLVVLTQLTACAYHINACTRHWSFVLAFACAHVASEDQVYSLDGAYDGPAYLNNLPTMVYITSQSPPFFFALQNDVSTSVYKLRCYCHA